MSAINKKKETHIYVHSSLLKGTIVLASIGLGVLIGTLYMQCFSKSEFSFAKMVSLSWNSEYYPPTVLTYVALMLGVVSFVFLCLFYAIGGTKYRWAMVISIAIFILLYAHTIVHDLYAASQIRFDPVPYDDGPPYPAHPEHGASNSSTIEMIYKPAGLDHTWDSGSPAYIWDAETDLISQLDTSNTNKDLIEVATMDFVDDFFFGYIMAAIILCVIGISFAMFAPVYKATIVTKISEANDIKANKYSSVIPLILISYLTFQILILFMSIIAGMNSGYSDLVAMNKSAWYYDFSYRLIFIEIVIYVSVVVSLIVQVSKLNDLYTQTIGVIFACIGLVGFVSQVSFIHNSNGLDKPTGWLRDFSDIYNGERAIVPFAMTGKIAPFLFLISGTMFILLKNSFVYSDKQGQVKEHVSPETLESAKLQLDAQLIKDEAISKELTIQILIESQKAELLKLQLENEKQKQLIQNTMEINIQNATGELPKSLIDPSVKKLDEKDILALIQGEK